MLHLIYEQESYLIRKAIFEVYKTFRNIHKERVYHNALIRLLNDYGFDVVKNKQLPVHFKGAIVGTYVPDIIVNGIIVLELKCKSFMGNEDKKQFWEYLKTSGYRLGFLINFGKSNGVEIIRRVYG